MVKSRIKTVTVPDALKAQNMTALQQEQFSALQDLINNSYFQPHNDNNGPYDVTLSIEENKLILRMRNAEAKEITALILSLHPYRRLIQDYFLLIESYDRARQNCATFDKLEAIDMGRRGLHNEGANLIRARLKDKIDMDLETARRIFSLICLLSRRNGAII